MRRILLTVALVAASLLMAASETIAGGWYYRLNSNGLYTWTNGSANNGYYYKRYRTCGCRTYGKCSHGWRYRQVGPILTSSYTTSGNLSFENRALDIAAQIAQQSYAMDASAHEHSMRLETMAALGLQGLGARYQSYGARATGAGFGAAAYGGFGGGFGAGGGGLGFFAPFAQQGSTVFGRTFNSYRPAYGVDTAALFDKANRTTNNAGQIYDKAIQSTNEVAKTLGSDAAAIEKIRAAGEVVATVQQSNAALLSQAIAAQGQGDTVSTKTTTTTTDSQQPAPGEFTATESGSYHVGAVPTSNPDELAAIVENKCYLCHGQNGKVSGALNFDAMVSLSPVDRAFWGAKISDRLTTADPGRRMPPPDSPAGDLTPAERVKLIGAF